jgi:hypothetical protein
MEICKVLVMGLMQVGKRRKIGMLVGNPPENSLFEAKKYMAE